jgi:hypothetical protein
LPRIAFACGLLDLQPFFLLDLLRKPVLGELSAPLVNTVFWRFVTTRAVPDPHNAGQRKSFLQSILRYCWTREIDAAGSLG